MPDDANKPASAKRSIDWLDVLKVAAVPLVAAVLGFTFNKSLNDRQSKENNLRLYADMMARREQADSDLRKDMFKSILDKFTSGKPDPKSLDYLEDQVVNLELLAYNFHESIDLGPLFKHLRRAIPDSQQGLAPDVYKRYQQLRKRLESVAVEVNERQLTVVRDSGAVVRPMADGLNQMQEAAARIAFFDPAAVASKGAKPEDDKNQVCLAIYSPEDKVVHHRRFKVEVIDYDAAAREVQVRLYVSKPLESAACRSVDLDLKGSVELDIRFWVGIFDFPMIDNTRLTHSARCSVSVTYLTPDRAELALAYFPSSRASLKDKPYYDELEHNLLHTEPGEVPDSASIQ
jgi:hypothetical protein